MLFVDLPWLQQHGFALPEVTLSTSSGLYGRLLEVFAGLFDDRPVPDKEALLVAFFAALPGYFDRANKASAGRSTRGLKWLPRSSAPIVCDPLTWKTSAVRWGFPVPT
jgi:hypothetical protein